METSAGWDDSDLGGVRPYLLTRGRTRPTRPLRLTTCLITCSAPGSAVFDPESEALRLLCSGACRSVAELSAHLHQPVQVIKILASDLLDAGALSLAAPSGATEPDVPTLEALRDALYAWV